MSLSHTIEAHQFLTPFPHADLNGDYHHFQSLFSMPMFQWNATSSSDVVSDRFWIHWAVTGPLTTVTILAWLIWTWWRNEVYVARNANRATTFWPAVSRSLQRRGNPELAQPDHEDAPLPTPVTGPLRNC